MAHKLQSIAVGACRQISRRCTSVGVARPYSASTTTVLSPLHLQSAAVVFSPHNNMIGYQCRQYHSTNITQDDKGSGDGAAPATKTADDASTTVAPFTSPRVEELFNKIIWLDMVEVHLLAELINEKMGIKISDAERERMARGGGGGGKKKASGDGAKEEEVAAEEKTAFDLKLTGFDAKSKIKIIKEVRGMTSLGLKEAKELVEGAPATVKKDIKKEEAEELKGKLEALGATVEIV